MKRKNSVLFETEKRHLKCAFERSMKQLWALTLAGILLFGEAYSEDKKLLFVQIIFRHGDRTPIMLYPNDPNPASLWPEGLNALTTLGKKQHYAVGKYFRSRYENFATFSPLEVNAMSASNDRCLLSAVSNMASFFSPNPGWSIDANLPWQPIPIHYRPRNLDKLLSMTNYCPRADVEEQKTALAPESQKALKKHEKMLNILSSLSGSKIDDWSKAFLFHDVILIEKKYNLTVPTWVDPYWDELTIVSDASYYWKYNSPLLQRLRSGPLIKKIIETMNQKINGEIPKLKFQVFSVHESFLALFLNALKSYNMIQPPYCASLMIELFEMPDGMKTVRFLYQNSSKPEEKMDPPQIFILEGCTEFCPLDYFINYTRPLIPEDRDLECQLPKSFVEIIKERRFTILLVAVMAMLSVFLLWKIYSRRQKKFAYQRIE